MRDRTGESTAAWRPQPAARAAFSLTVVGALAWSLAGPARAQVTAVVQREDVAFLAEPGGVRLGRVVAGTTVAAGSTRSGHTQVTLEGWIWRASVRAAQRDGHNLAVSRAPEENLREARNGRVLARLTTGCLLDEVERRGEWIHVRRAGWVTSGALAPRQTATARGGAPPSTALDTGAAVPEGVDVRRGIVRRRLQLFRAPDAPPLGTLEAGAPVRVTARAGGWIRVETQGWVRESEIRPARGGALSNVTAAEMRAAPDEYRGQLVRWTIQFISLQTADDLRPDFLPGQRYILARGPAPEYAFVYVIVPPDKLGEVARFEPLSSVRITARVRSGRSAYLANPVLELVDLEP